MTDINPLVTIIIPSYNHQRYIEQSILSAINQSYGNVEVIIIDDGSSDSSPEIIKRVIEQYSGEKNITFLRQNNIGLSKTLNKALSMAKGEYVQFLASDDAYLPDKTSVCVETLHKTSEKIAAVYTDGYIVNQKGQKTARFSDKYIRPISSNVYEELLIGNWIPALGLLYKKNFHKKNKSFSKFR